MSWSSAVPNKEANFQYQTVARFKNEFFGLFLILSSHPALCVVLSRFSGADTIVSSVERHRADGLASSS